MTATAGHAHEGNGDHQEQINYYNRNNTSSRRGSFVVDHISSFTPAPSPHGRVPSDYASSSSAPVVPAATSTTTAPSTEPGVTNTPAGAIAHHHQPQQQPSSRHDGGPQYNHHPHFTPEHSHQQQQPHPNSGFKQNLQDYPGHSDNQYSGHQHSQNTPSPPLPSPSDSFHGRPLLPVEPTSPSAHVYRSDSRRGSVADTEHHDSSAMAVDREQRRPSNSSIVESSPSGYYGSNSTTPASITVERRHYAITPTAAASSPSPATSAEAHNHPHHGPYAPHSTSSSHAQQHPSTSPLQLRQSEQFYNSGRRESLPSIHSSAGPLGQLLAQEPQRRHSIAHGDPMGPLKRKISTPLSQVHSSTAEHPAKRRDSIPDASIHHHHHSSHSHNGHGHGHGHGHGLGGHHHPHPHHHHPYPLRSSLSVSAPSSPPRRASVAPTTTVPTLNLQPAAEIKSSPSHHGAPVMPNSNSSSNGSNGINNGYNNINSSNGMSSSHISHINGNMDYARPHFTQHQPRRPSLLSDASLSRRSSVADVSHHYPPSHYQSSSSSSSLQQQTDYDGNMNMDLENMHLTGERGGPSHNGPEAAGGHGYGGPSGPGSTPSAPGSGAPTGAHHLYPGYPAYPLEGGAKGDTPYSRSPELRVSHKLAERKRRKEMKELFDELRDSLPVDRSLKTSKWEILSKAVDFISSMKSSHDELAKEVDMLRQEMSRLQKR